MTGFIRESPIEEMDSPGVDRDVLFEIAKSIAILIILGNAALVDFMQNHYSVATFVHINLPKANFLL